MNDNDMSARVGEALERTKIMALSTSGPDGSWTSPVQYRSNDQLELLFLSMRDTKHVANSLQDPRMSVAIYSFPGLPGDERPRSIQSPDTVLKGSRSMATNTAWTNDELARIGASEELEIAPLRQDGSLRHPVTIWVVRSGDDLYVRSVNGRTAAWFRAAQVRHEGHIEA